MHNTNNNFALKNKWAPQIIYIYIKIFKQVERAISEKKKNENETKGKKKIIEGIKRRVEDRTEADGKWETLLHSSLQKPAGQHNFSDTFKIILYITSTGDLRPRKIGGPVRAPISHMPLAGPAYLHMQ